MKKLLSIVGTVMFSLTATTLVYAATADGTGPWADGYQDFQQVGTVRAARSNPQAAVGVSESTGLDQETTFTESQFLSLGFGGTITLTFTNSIIDGQGDDLMVYEVTGPGTYPIEKAKVEVSSNGTDFVEIGEIERDGSLDLAGKASCVQYVRITDTSDKSLPFGTGDTVDGFDLDGVKALNTNESGCVFDDDEDGITNSQDMCQTTSGPDEWSSEDLGVNRWMFDGTNWLTKNPKTKLVDSQTNPYQSEKFLGCTCTDILNVIKSEAGAELEGHYTHGCSKSILEDWSNNTYHVGPTLIDTVSVPSDESVASTTQAISTDKTYILKSSGTYTYTNWAGEPWADAKCSYRGTADPLGFSGQTMSGDLLPAPYTHYLELRVNNNVVDWGVPSGTCSTNNEYTMQFTGVDHFNFNIFDGNATTDNDGDLTVEIFEDKWVNLW